ncbi:MAG: hypothetical protein A2Z16_05635 [Chloroflexi bacterium RBG_16_54_18]|nr:MAG: hypothetical protein A2Z16_05635 [Chloroflexi bacterium RBG_16_54_18]
MTSSFEDSLSSLPSIANPRIIPTGSIKLDAALGIGGIPGGLLVEISGPQSSGKTTLCQHIMAESQKLDGVCALIDADQTWDPRYAIRCGVDINRLVVCNTFNTAAALDSLSILAKSGALSVIVLDSISSLVPFTCSNPDQSRHDREDPELRISKTLRLISHSIRRNQTAVIFTCLTLPRNQAIYHSLAFHTYRLALKLHASIRLRLSSINILRKSGKNIGRRVKAQIIKNSFHPCQQFADLDIMYSSGIIRSGEFFDL